MTLPGPARELFETWKRGEEPPAAALDRCIEQALEDGGAAFFSELVEPLADHFEPRFCDIYARLFARCVERALPGYRAAQLVARYRRVRRLRKCTRRDVRRIYVLSRVTLGADVAVTSVVMDGLKRRFPEAEILFTGNRKGYELFAGDPRIGYAPVAYGRNDGLRERLEAARHLRDMVAERPGLVVDPDSRISQLGLLPLCPEQDYYFFESRGYGGGGDDPLPVLAARWVEETFGVSGARAYIAPADPWVRQGPPPITVSLGVGGNLAKRIGGGFEAGLLRLLAASGQPLIIDKGAGGEEAERVEQAVQQAGLAGAVDYWDGAFAPFASRIAASRLYAGYDSAGGHVAAACGVPLISICAGFVSDRMAARWRPTGDGPVELIPVKDSPADPAAVLEKVSDSLRRLLGGTA